MAHWKKYIWSLKQDAERFLFRISEIHIDGPWDGPAGPQFANSHLCPPSLTERFLAGCTPVTATSFRLLWEGRVKDILPWMLSEHLCFTYRLYGFDEIEIIIDHSVTLYTWKLDYNCAIRSVNIRSLFLSLISVFLLSHWARRKKVCPSRFFLLMPQDEEEGIVVKFPPSAKGN